jgi:NTE family protein
MKLRSSGAAAAAAVSLLASTSMAAEAPVPAPAQPEAIRSVVAASPGSRPRIGLALGGGGAKGAAHVGVLTLLEDMRVPVDCIVGTSMGALVGGTFATGMTAAELERAIGKIDWSKTIGAAGQREKLPMRRKLAGRTYSNTLEFGLGPDGLSAPRGFISTQNIEQTIRYLVSRSLGTNDFDRLPIPFRAVATDMISGEMVVLSEGDLAQSMRASMAVPGVFAPVTIDGRTLGDGGLARNLPVDIARQTCADVVIAVSVPTPAPAPEALQSPLAMISRTLDVLIGANEREQLGLLGPQDVSIVVPMGDIGSASFDRAKEAIPLGRKAAELQREQLRRYSLPEAEYRAWRDSTRRPELREIRLAEVQVEGLQRIDPDFVRATLGLEAGQVVSQRELTDATQRLFDVGDFDTVQFTTEGDPDNVTLRVDASEKSFGPNIVRFDLGLAMGTEGTNAFVLSADLLRTWINPRGGELHGQLQFGRNSLAGASLYQPLDAAHRWFVEPGVRLSRSTEDIFFDNEAISRYDFDTAYGSLDFGRVFGQSAELRTGLRAGSRGAERLIAVPELPNFGMEGYGGAILEYTYDDRDRDALATRGWVGRMRYYRGFEELGADNEYDRIEGMVARTVPLWGNVVRLRATGGGTFEGDLPLYDFFTVGGPNSFPGLSFGQWRGTSYWTGSVAYLHKVAEISTLFGQAIYAGAEFVAGDMSGRIDGLTESTTYGGSLVLGGRTPIGSMSFSIATTSTDDWSLLFMLGRPIEERNVVDEVW